MVIISELSAEITRNGDKWSDIAKFLNISPQAVYRKRKGITEFTREDIQKIKEKYKLTPERISEIFFA